MKKKMQKMHRHKLLYEDVLKQVEKEDVFIIISIKGGVFSKCTKFRDQAPHPITLDRALQFLWLKEQKIDRKIALQFGQRRVCKIDSTMKHDGPSSARIIKTSKIDQGMINGWHNGAGDSKFDLGPQYNIKKLEKTKRKLKQQSPSEYKIKLNHQDLYNNDISEKYAFSNMDTKQLLQKLNELKQINKQKNEQPQDYVEVEGQRFYHVLSDIEDYLDKKVDNKTLIQEMRAFQTFYPIKRKLQIKQLNPGDPLCLGTESQTDGAQKSTSSRLFDRKRTFTNMKCELFNTNNYVFHVREVPNIGQQLRRNHFSQLIEELRENGMRTPREIHEVSPENSIKASQIESNKEILFEVPEIKGESSQTTSRTKSQRFGTLQSQLSHQYPQQPQKASMSNLYGSSTEIRLESPGKSKNRLDSRIDRYVKQYLKNQNTIQQNQNVDMTVLREKYKSLKTEREKEITRMYKSQQIEGINNKTVHLQ